MEYCRTWNPAARDVFFCCQSCMQYEVQILHRPPGIWNGIKGNLCHLCPPLFLNQVLFSISVSGQDRLRSQSKKTLSINIFKHGTLKHIWYFNHKSNTLFLTSQMSILHLDSTSKQYASPCVTLFALANLTLNPLPKHLVVGKLRKFLVKIISSGIRIGGKMPVVTMDVCSQWFIKEYFRNVPKLKIGPISFGDLQHLTPQICWHQKGFRFPFRLGGV